MRPLAFPTRIQPRSGGGDVSPGREPRVKWEIALSRVAATPALKVAGTKLSFRPC